MPRAPDDRSAPERRLPEGYYVDNFEIVLETAAERYGDLLHPPEEAFYRCFRALSTGAKRLYVRLLSRRGPLFRRDRLHYPEIPDQAAALDELFAAGFADRAAGAGTGALLALLLRPELAALLKDLTGASAGTLRKAELAGVLLETVDDADLRRAVRTRIDVLRPLHEDHVETFRLLFFGNLSQDWTEFVLRDLGVVRYEPYELRRDLRLFADRRAFDDAMTLRNLRDVVEVYLVLGYDDDALEVAEHVLARSGGYHPSTHPVRDRILNRLGRCLERRGELERALRLYEAAERPPARERRARILDRLGRLDQALGLCREIAESHRDETEAAFAPRFIHRLRRKLGEELPALRRRRRPLRTLVLPQPEGGTIESAALEALEARGRAGFFSENWLWSSLFGLAFWDVVFAPVAGAFEHPFQYGPLDLATPEFRRRRSAAIEARLAELRDDPEPGRRLLSVYDAKRDTANRLVAWNEQLRPLLELALSRLHGRHLAPVCDRLSRDVRRYRRGLPDLFVVDGSRDPGFRLYEVKGPGDQLRPEQGAWIDYLNDRGLPTYILKVSWS